MPEVIMKTRLLSLFCAVTGLATAWSAEPPVSPSKTMPKPVVTLSEDEWKQRLTPEQYAVTRLAGTERPFGAIYEEFEKQGAGTYYCVGCGAELFTSKEKFHSGCGWPSFYDASSAKNVVERADHSHGMIRVETLCKRCGAHLGHVFEGESVSAATPTKRRFCINGVALHYVPAGGTPPPLLEPNSSEVQKKKEAIAKEAEASQSKKP